jgi:hypothetical protein
MGEGDTLTIPPRQCVVFADAPKVIPLVGGENILQVITEAGVFANFNDIKIIRATSIKQGKPDIEKVDLQKFLQKQDRSALVPVNDGDVVILNVPHPGQNFLTNAMQFLYPIAFLRSFVP